MRDQALDLAEDLAAIAEELELVEALVYRKLGHDDLIVDIRNDLTGCTLGRILVTNTGAVSAI